MSDDPFDSSANPVSYLGQRLTLRGAKSLDHPIPTVDDNHHSGGPSAPVIDQNPPSTVDNPPAASVEAAVQGLISHSTPVKPSLSTTNQHAFEKKKGKARGPPLVEQAGGMGSRFHELPIELFDKIVPGDSPTPTQRAQFKYCSVKRVKRENGLYGKAVSYLMFITNLTLTKHLVRFYQLCPRRCRRH